MSLAVNLTMKLAEVAGQALNDKDADVEIIERHHRFKEDAPSGTALKFGEIVAGAMGQTRAAATAAKAGPASGRTARSATMRSASATIRASTRSSSACSARRIELTVRATNRDCYAQGALAAAKFLAGKPAGLYGMSDVLGL